VGCDREKASVSEGKAGGGKTDVKIASDLQEYICHVDIAILDPPRAGCRPELLETANAASSVLNLLL